MNEDRLIEKEYHHFIDIYSNADETKLKIANDLFWKAAFLKVFGKTIAIFWIFDTIM